MTGKLAAPARRLLTLAEAASYCGVTTAVFARSCPVTPISLDVKGRDDRRLLRYDVVLLDGWIDRLSGVAEGRPEVIDWLAGIPG